MNKKIKPDAINMNCLYFSREGRENTLPTLKAAKKRAEELDVQDLVVASTSGQTGVLAAEMLSGRNVVIVTHSTGFVQAGQQEMVPDLKKKIENTGARILTCQHAFGGVGRAVRKKLGTYELEEIMAFTLRIFGEGTKVAVESALMAADAGLISVPDACISIGGTARGADTAVLLKPAHAQNFFDMRIMEFLAKPRLEVK